MVLIGLPQLLIFPFVPRLMKAFDLRLIVFVGALIFGGSCLLNIHMNPDFGGPQFQIGNIIRALGQPFTILLPLGYSGNNRRTDRLFSIS
jgi:MFS transporter, DHA2 family, multidrug resistance protein